MPASAAHVPCNALEQLPRHCRAPHSVAWVAFDASDAMRDAWCQASSQSAHGDEIVLTITHPLLSVDHDTVRLDLEPPRTVPRVIRAVSRVALGEWY